jgi:hypothetical protein
MNPSVYIESTIPSFIVGETSPVIVGAARQITTRRWWNDHRRGIAFTSRGWYGKRLREE